MLANYIIQASLVTFYAIVLLLNRNESFATKIGRTDKLSHFVAAIAHSAKLFLNASILFAMAMLLAACFVFVTRLQHRGTALAFLNQKWTFLLSVYTTIPAFLLDICISDSLRRRRGRVALWTALWALSLLVLGLWLAITLDPRNYESPQRRAHYSLFEDSDQQLTWDYYCLGLDVRSNAYWMLYSFTAALGVLGLLHVALNWRIFPCRSRKCASSMSAIQAREKILQSVRVLIAVGYVSLMWWCLARFMLLRWAIKKSAGDSSQDYEWSFGQVLGLASWVPVLVELAYVWWEGPEVALTGQWLEAQKTIVKTEVEMVEIRREDERELLAQTQRMQ